MTDINIQASQMVKHLMRRGLQKTLDAIANGILWVILLFVLIGDRKNIASGLYDGTQGDRRPGG